MSNKPQILLEKSLLKGGIRVFNDRPDFPFYEVKQIHGAEVLNALDLTLEESGLQEADGIYFSSHDEIQAPLAIKTADCLPITIIGEEGVAHLHAGWRGVHQLIFDHVSVKAIRPLEVFIGPAIQQESYEVGAEFHEHFPALEHCFKKSFQKERLLFNLPQAASHFLKVSYPQAKQIICDCDTFTTPGHNSFRKDKTEKRNYSVYYPEHLW